MHPKLFQKKKEKGNVHYAFNAVGNEFRKGS